MDLSWRDFEGSLKVCASCLHVAVCEPRTAIATEARRFRLQGRVAPTAITA